MVLNLIYSSHLNRTWPAVAAALQASYHIMEIRNCLVYHEKGYKQCNFHIIWLLYEYKVDKNDVYEM